MVSIIKSHNNFNDDCFSIVKKTSNKIEIFDFNTLELSKVINTVCWLFQISVSFCGKFVAGSNEKNYVFVWNIETGDLIEKIVLNDLDYQPFHTFTPDGNLMIGYATRIYCFSYSSDINKFQMNYTYTIPETDTIITSVVHNSSDMFACGTNSGSIYVFNTTSNQLVHTLSEFTTNKDEHNEIYSIDFKNNMLVASSWGKKQICFDLAKNTNQVLEKPKFGNYHTPFIISNLLITPCVTKVIGTYNYHTFIWDLSTGKIIKKMDFDIHSEHAFTPDGSKLVISSGDQIIKILDYDE